MKFGAFPGRFLVFEGVDGSGKSTQVGLCVEALRASGQDVVQVREPGGTALSQAIRELVLDPTRSVSPEAELLLYMAARAQLVAEVIRPALIAGKVVVADRFGWSTYAYQGYGRGLNRDMIASLMAAACGEVWPDFILVLDIAPEIRRSRLLAQGRSLDRLEREDDSFFARVREGFHALVGEGQTPSHLLDGGESVESLQKSISYLIQPFLPPLPGLP